jgi:hypothetical protein
MDFKRYPKIHRLGKDETDGILFGRVHVEEKIDGANAQIWFDGEHIKVGSRNNTLTKGVDIHEEVGTFNGLIDYVKNHQGIRNLLKYHPNYRLYGEWLVRHTVQYKETNYKQFYLFDVSVWWKGSEKMLPKEDVINLALQFNIKIPNYHGVFDNPTEEVLMELVGKSELGDRGEGIVLRNFDFINKFGDLEYAKIVSESFKEDNAVTFGGNNKHSETYFEMWVVNKYMTLPRIEKIMNKLQPQIDKKLDLEHIPRVCNSAYHDMITEEIWEIQKKVEHLNFRHLQRCALKKAIQIYKDILSGSISVADRVN